MQFAIICTDRADAGTTRADTRDEHLRYLDGQLDSLMHVGPILDESGKPTGSLVVIDVPDRTAAAAFAAADPYAKAGLFTSVTIHGHRMIFSHRARVG